MVPGSAATITRNVVLPREHNQDAGPCLSDGTRLYRWLPCASYPMDLLLTSALRESCYDTGAAYRRYIVDFQDVSIVRDSGLALLLMLKRWANRAGARLYVINGSSDLMRRCFSLGIRSA